MRSRYPPRPLATRAATLCFAVAVASCRAAPAHSDDRFGHAPNETHAQPLLLPEAEGERRVRRPPPASLSNLMAPFIIKLDRQNSGAPEFVMMMEDIAPGQGIPPHSHPHSDEILFVRDGVGVAVLGGREATVRAGATIYMPRNTSVRLRNTGTVPLRVIAIFSRPGYENYMREISVPEGEVAKPLTVEELTSIRARYHAQVVYDQP
ncbi:MAG: hypothetical protein NVS4B3_05130 [Gemmatimonadaceae bacterium]